MQIQKLSVRMPNSQSRFSSCLPIYKAPRTIHQCSDKGAYFSPAQRRYSKALNILIAKRKLFQPPEPLLCTSYLTHSLPIVRPNYVSHFLVQCYRHQTKCPGTLLLFCRECWVGLVCSLI